MCAHCIEHFVKCSFQFLDAVALQKHQQQQHFSLYIILNKWVNNPFFIFNAPAHWHKIHIYISPSGGVVLYFVVAVEFNEIQHSSSEWMLPYVGRGLSLIQINIFSVHLPVQCTVCTVHYAHDPFNAHFQCTVLMYARKYFIIFACVLLA